MKVLLQITNNRSLNVSSSVVLELDTRGYYELVVYKELHEDPSNHLLCLRTNMKHKGLKQHTAKVFLFCFLV